MDYFSKKMLGWVFVVVKRAEYHQFEKNTLVSMTAIYPGKDRAQFYAVNGTLGQILRPEHVEPVRVAGIERL